MIKFRWLTWVAALLFLLCVPTVAWADEVSAESYWQLIADLQDTLSDGNDPARLTDELETITSVTRADGQTVTLENRYLVAQLRDAESSEQAAQILNTYLQTQALDEVITMPDAQSDLDRVLGRSEFDYEPQPATWRERLGREVQQFLASSINSQSGRVFAWIVAGVAVFVLGGIIFYWLRGIRSGFVKESEIPSIEQEMLTLSADDAFQRAQANAAKGDYRLGVRYLYLSTLLILDERGQLRYDRSKTNREFLRSLSGNPEIAGTLQKIVDVFDRVWYGFYEVDSAEYQTYAERIEKLRSGR